MEHRVTCRPTYGEGPEQDEFFFGGGAVDDTDFGSFRESQDQNVRMKFLNQTGCPFRLHHVRKGSERPSLCVGAKSPNRIVVEF